MRVTDKAWSKLNSFLLSVGSAESIEELNQEILKNISSIIPFDNSGVSISLREGIDPKITASVNSENRWNDLFNSHYHSISIFPDFDRNIFYADNLQLRDAFKTEYYNDFLLPQKIRYTAGFILFSRENIPCGTLVLNRSDSCGMFSDEELMLLKISAQHISNYSRMLSISESLKKIPVMITELETGNKILSPRETEIVSLLMKRMKPSEISRELKISLLTVRKHIQNIYDKLNVMDRKQLYQRINQNYKTGN